jgi:hypothetical protein
MRERVGQPPGSLQRDKCGDRRDVPRFLHAIEPKERLVNVPVCPYVPRPSSSIDMRALELIR